MTLQDVIGKDIFIFEAKHYADKDFQEMTLEELETFKARLNRKKTDIADKIKAMRDVETAEWFVSKKYALSLHTKMITYINFAIKQRIKKDRGLSDHFMEQAKILLPEKEFETILNNAGKVMGLGRDE